MTEEVRPETTTHAEPERDSGELATPAPLPRGWDDPTDPTKEPAVTPDLADSLKSNRDELTKWPSSAKAANHRTTLHTASTR